MKKNTSTRNLMLILTGIIYLTVCVIAAIISGFDEDFFAGFGFFTFSLAVTVAVILVAAGKNVGLERAFFNVPIYYLSVFYFGICAVLDFIHMLFGTFSMKLTFIVQILLFAAFAFLFVLTLVNVTASRAALERTREKNRFIREAALRVETIKGSVSNSELKKALELLGEEFKYSKPSSSSSVLGIEEELQSMISVLSDIAADEESASDTIVYVSKIKAKLVERNNLAKKSNL